MVGGPVPDSRCEIGRHPWPVRICREGSRQALDIWLAELSSVKVPKPKLQSVFGRFAVPGMYRDLGLQESTIWVEEEGSVDTGSIGRSDSRATSSWDTRCQARSIPDCHVETNRQLVLDSRFNAGVPSYTSH